MMRYWVHRADGEQITGPFDHPVPARMCQRALEAETSNEYELRPNPEVGD